MVVKYTPLAAPEYPNINVMGSFAQGAALQQNALRQRALENQLQEQEATRNVLTQPDFDLMNPNAVKQLTGAGALDEALKVKSAQEQASLRHSMEQNYINEVLIRGKKFDAELPGLRAIARKNVAEATDAELKNMTTASQVTQDILSRAAEDGSDWDQVSGTLRKLDPNLMVPDTFNPKWNERMMRTAKLYQDVALDAAKKKASPEYEEVKQGDFLVGMRPKYGGGPVLSMDEYNRYTESREGTGKNPLSSAQGPGQFIDSTFVNTFRKTFPDQAQGMSRDQILAQRGTGVEEKMLPVLTQENVGALKSAGFQPSKGNTYLAHFLGAPNAIDVLEASPDTPVADILSPKVIKSNPEVFAKAKTAGDLIRWAGGEMPSEGGGLVPKQMKPVGTSDRAAQDAALKILSDLEFDPSGQDRVSKLIGASTSGLVETGLSQIPRAFGATTPGRKAIADLEVLAGEYTLEKLNNKLGAGFSNEDREFIAKSMGDIANPMLPAGERLSAWQQVKHRLASRAGIKLPEIVKTAEAKPRGVAGETEKPAERKRMKWTELGD